MGPLAGSGSPRNCVRVETGRSQAGRSSCPTGVDECSARHRVCPRVAPNGNTAAVLARAPALSESRSVLTRPPGVNCRKPSSVRNAWAGLIHDGARSQEWSNTTGVLPLALAREICVQGLSLSRVSSAVASAETCMNGRSEWNSQKCSRQCSR
ncbi:hypothetical protein D9M68_784690 [compost metagenome]